MVELINGRAFASSIKRSVAQRVAVLPGSGPKLAVVLVGSDPASEIYVRNKIRSCHEVGIRSLHHRLPADAGQAEVAELLCELNRDPDVDGILLHLPLPAHLDARALIDLIAPAKDVDGLGASNAGRLVTGQPGMVPCTPLGVLMLLRSRFPELRGKTCTVIGCSPLVGRPMIQLLLKADCTVSVAHRHTRDIATLCRNSDIVIVAAGVPRLVKADWIKPGATVIDVGINRVRPDGDARHDIVGDVDFEGVSRVAGAITPVPGGVGPITVACLLQNTLRAHCLARGLPTDSFLEHGTP